MLRDRRASAKLERTAKRFLSSTYTSSVYIMLEAFLERSSMLTGEAYRVIFGLWRRNLVR
jgi:hypothetical protein